MENHLDGLPEHGVLLTGSPANPVIENHSGRVVIGFVLKTADQNGGGPTYQMLLALSVQPAGIPDGGSIYVRGNRLKSSGEGPIVTVILRSVVFANGQFVGVDDGAFESFGTRIKAIVEVGLLGKTGAWEQVETLAEALTRLSSARPPDGADPILSLDRLSAAARLVRERKFGGDAAALQLARLYSSLPTLWK